MARPRRKKMTLKRDARAAQADGTTEFAGTCLRRQRGHRDRGAAARGRRDEVHEDVGVERPGGHGARPPRQHPATGEGGAEGGEGETGVHLRDCGTERVGGRGAASRSSAAADNRERTADARRGLGAGRAGRGTLSASTAASKRPRVARTRKREEIFAEDDEISDEFFIKITAGGRKKDRGAGLGPLLFAVPRLPLTERKTDRQRERRRRARRTWDVRYGSSRCTRREVRVALKVGGR